MDSFVVRPLDPSQLRAAYPLIRQAAPSVDLKDWRRFARRAADPRSAGRRGVMVAHRVGRPHPSGLFCYVKEQDLRQGAVLIGSHFIVLDMFEPGAVLKALVGALDGLARQLDCRAIRASPSDGGQDLSACLIRAGLRMEGVVFSKAVAPAS